MKRPGENQGVSLFAGKYLTEGFIIELFCRIDDVWLPSGSDWLCSPGHCFVPLMIC